MSSPKARRHPVMPSVLKSETFIFALLVLGLAICVPLYLSGGPTTPIGSANVTTSGVSKSAIHQPTSPVLPTIPTPETSASPKSSVQPAAITYLVPSIISFIKVSIHFLFRIPGLVYSLIYSTVLRPLSYPLSLLLALLRPLTLLLEIVYILLVRTPYVIVSWTVREAIYPLYVFAGVAVLLGGSVGMSISQVPKGLIRIIHLVQSRRRGPSPKLISSRGPMVGSNRSVLASIDGDGKVEGSDVSERWRSRPLSRRNRH